MPRKTPLFRKERESELELKMPRVGKEALIWRDEEIRQKLAISSSLRVERLGEAERAKKRKKSPCLRIDESLEALFFISALRKGGASRRSLPPFFDLFFRFLVRLHRGLVLPVRRIHRDEAVGAEKHEEEVPAGRR